MPKLFSIQEICRPCNEMVDTKIAEFWEYDHLFYVLPSGKEVQKCTFYVPVWCRECEEFTLAYKPLDSCRVDYHIASCTRCSSSNIDDRWWNNRNKKNQGFALKLGPTKKHSCGGETSYVVSEGRFSWGRKWPKSQYFDCADNAIEV